MAQPRPISKSIIPAVLLTFILLASAFAAEQSPRLEIHSAHYTVITDAGDKKGREVALRFEQMRAVFAALLMKERLNEPVPLTILAFKNDKTYFQSAPLRRGQPIGAAGFFVLIPLFGVMGAVAATTVSFVCMALMLRTSVKTVTGIDASVLRLLTKFRGAQVSAPAE